MKNNTNIKRKRPKALFGEEAAAILGAAAINVAGQNAAALINAKATNDAAKVQADSITASAQQQADALQKQSEASKEYQEQAQEFMRAQNDQNRQIQKDIQMQLQMLNGQQNVNDRLEASKIKVKYGGNIKTVPYLRGNNIQGLYGVASDFRQNIPFVVTDGGGVIPLGKTETGYDLYELAGNDHKHYHKTKTGKYKTGVGIKFANGSIIEGEGNQHTSIGEKMLVTPNNAYFISKHTMEGFNPSKAVDNGMNPLVAYYIQENIKHKKGISNDNDSSPVNKASMGGTFTIPLEYYSTIKPDLSSDISGAVATGAAYANKNKMKNGGRLKYWSGGFNLGNKWYESGNFLGSVVGGIGNVMGGAITSAANTKAGKYMADAYTKAGNIMANAYNNLQTIDLNNIKREDYSAAHAMPALQAPISQAESQIVGINRDRDRIISNINQNSTSSAAGNTRIANVITDAQDAKNKVYATDQQLMQGIRQANAKRITQAAMQNAKADTMANTNYTNALMYALKYNNEITNQKILGAADSIANAATQSTNALAQVKANNAQVWGNAITNTTNLVGNALTAMAKEKFDLNTAFLGATSDAQFEYILRMGDIDDLNAESNAINKILENPNLSAENRETWETRQARIQAEIERRKK